MVVQFTPAPEGAGRIRAAGDDHLAPVSYLPGAKPTAAAESLRARIANMASTGTIAGAVTSGRVGDDADSSDIDSDDVDGYGVESSDDGKTDARFARSSPKQSKRASNVSMHQLARRGMSRWELQQVLDKRGVEIATAHAELDRLESVGLLDDAALAVTLVYTQHTRNGLGRKAIAAELKRRHIDKAIIDDALSEIADDDEEYRAHELAVRRVRQYSGLDRDTATRRLVGYLARKGYSSGVIGRAVTEAFKEL
jgi:SOS response regulatory protein OraA/RecX